MKELADRVAVVTGGASGIGLALARAFLNQKMSVVVADIEQEGHRRRPDRASVHAAPSPACAPM